MPRLLSNPLASLLLAGLLLYDATHLAPAASANRWLFGPRIALPADAGGGPSAIVARTEAGIEVFNREDAIVTQEPRLLTAEWMLLADYRETPSVSGFWGLTSQRLTSAIYLLNPQSESRPIPPEVEREARTALIDWLVANRGLPEAQARQLRAGNIYRASPRWPGYLHNTLTLAGLALFLFSLTWIPRETIGRIRARRRARGLCMHCCYPVSGVDSPVCPECGRPIPQPRSQPAPELPPRPST
ncbi:MAG: hypothetical protein IT436_01480 [Phycisphaerales bacterium]|nr:hypothetical protein [Phycisphaerales bacterium]